jgi:RNase H-fold protein (predicted Holliday junction resolvase)
MIKIVLAIDPGKKKCGIAVVDNNLRFIKGEVVEKEELIQEVKIFINKYSINNILIGGGTNSKEITSTIKNRFPGITVIEIAEKDTTMQARKRYFDYNPPNGFSKILPRSFLIPARPYDDFAALIIAERFFKNYEEVNDN